MKWRLCSIGLAIVVGTAGTPALAAPLDRLCTLEQGFGYRFGEPIADRIAASPFRANVMLGLDYRPFRNAEIMITEDSRRVHRVNASAAFRTEAEMRSFINAVRDAYRSAGWAPAPGSDSLMGDVSHVALPELEIELVSGSGAQRRQLEIATLGREVHVSCLAPELTREALREWLAPPAVGAARPQPPALPSNLALPRPNCTQPSQLAELETTLTPFSESWGPYAAAINRYYEQLIEWNGQQIVRSGRWTAAQKEAFEQALIARPEISSSMQAVMGSMMEMLSELSEVAELEQAGRQPEACAVVVRMFERIPQMAAVTLRQSAEIDRLYSIEAQRLGVSLD